MDPFKIENKSYGRLNYGKNLNFDEAYIDYQDENTEILDDEREHVNYRILTGVVLLAIVVLLGRAFFLQALHGQEYKALAEGNKLRVQYVLAPRGLIMDRNGKVIAANTPIFELAVVTADLPKDHQEYLIKLNTVAQIINADPDELADQISKMAPDSYQQQTLVSDITKDQALILLARANELKGFIAEDTATRDYKDPLAFTHLTGYTGKITDEELKAQAPNTYALNDFIGKTGIETQYEQYLHGINGKKQIEIDAAGDFKQTLAEVPATPGNNVLLNIDYDLQKTLYDAMVKVMEPKRATKAAAVAMNPMTGEVLALVSLPSFDSNMFAKGISRNDYANLINNPNNPLLNRVVAGQYPPGSTIKPMMGVAALSEKIVEPQTKLLDDGVIRVGTFTFYGYERAGLGLVDIYSAISKSSDIYFYTVGGGNPKTVVKEGMGPDKIASYFRKFGLGNKLGIDLPSEKPGLVPDPEWKERVIGEQWYLGNTYHMSIGQGDVLSTPLQVNSWTSTVANGGKVMQPYIFREAVNKDGRVIAKGEPKILNENMFDPNIIKVIQDAMRQTVTDGSGRSLASIPMPIAGKTGTAQFDARDLSLTHSWFTSYAPADNPQIAMTVIVESAGEGHAVAVPITKEVYTWYAENRYKNSSR